MSSTATPRARKVADRLFARASVSEVGLRDQIAHVTNRNEVSPRFADWLMLGGKLIGQVPRLSALTDCFRVIRGLCSAGQTICNRTATSKPAKRRTA